MRVRELMDYCKSIEIDCDKCEHQTQCNHLGELLVGLSPCVLGEMISNDLALDDQDD